MKLVMATLTVAVLAGVQPLVRVRPPQRALHEHVPHRVERRAHVMRQTDGYQGECNLLTLKAPAQRAASTGLTLRAASTKTSGAGARLAASRVGSSQPVVGGGGRGSSCDVR